MADRGLATLTVHGLEADNKLVRADIFAHKLRAFLAGLAAADKLANGKRLHRFMIEELHASEAVARIREKQRTLKPPQRSSIAAYEEAIGAVYNGAAPIERLPMRLVSTIKALSVGANKEFAHAEVSFESATVIRVDDFLLRQSNAALSAGRSVGDELKPPLFKGIAIGSFDGILQLIDSRGDMLRAKLITTAGDVEIDCVVNKARTPEFVQLFDQRVRIEGMAHYDGQRQLPVRVDVSGVKEIKKHPDLLRWHGAVSPASESDAESEW